MPLNDDATIRTIRNTQVLREVTIEIRSQVNRLRIAQENSNGSDPRLASAIEAGDQLADAMAAETDEPKTLRT